MALLAFLACHPAGFSQKDPAITEVEALRREKEIQMPYLDKSIIRSEINLQKVRDKKTFLQSGNKTLEQMTQRAVLVYAPARAARERVSLARRRILAAVRTLFPEAAFEMNDRQGDLSDQSFNSFNYRFKLKQPLFRGGALWNTLLQEKAGLEAAEKEYDAAIGDVINEVATAYFEYNRALEVIRSQEKAVSDMRGFAGISEKKYKEEIISEIEHLNVQSLYSQIRYDHETSKQELELAKLEIQKLLNLDIEDELKVAEVYQVEILLQDKSKLEAPSASPVEKVPSPSEDAAETPYPAIEENQQDDGYDFGEAKRILNLSHLVDMAYQNRPELQVETAKLESARLEERIRWGKTLPQADATLEFGKLGEAFDDLDLTPSKEREFRFMIEMSWNLGGNKVGYTYDNNQTAPTVSQFQGGAGSNTLRNGFSVGILDSLKDFVDAKEAEVARLDQVTQLEKKEKEVIQDVKKSYFDYQKARIQVKSSLQRVDYRRRLLQLSKHKLDKNEIQISEYLQSQIDILQELTTLHKAMSEYYTAKAKLNHAIGVRDYLPLEESNGRSTPART